SVPRSDVGIGKLAAPSELPGTTKLLCCRSHRGRALVTGGGSPRKLCAGGGDVVAHSSVHASHGFASASRLLRKLTMTFQPNVNIATPSTKAPMVARRLSGPHPGRSGYV